MKIRLWHAFAGLAVVLVAAVAVLAFTLSRTEECAPAPPMPEIEEGFTAVTYRCYGSPEILELATLEKPAPSGDEVLIRVRAAAVNPLDWHYMRGLPYFMRLDSGIGVPDDNGMGVDFAGVVEAVGPDVTRFEVGDRVFGGVDGAFAEYVLASETRTIARIPDEVSFEHAAAVPIAATTALQALRDKGRVAPGEKVLINGASGGVGTFAVQIAKSMGAEVHGVCSTRNVELVLSLGADRVFDYRNEDYTESDEEYDVIVDMVGNHSVGSNQGVLKPDGRLVIVGGPKGDWIAPFIRPLGALLRSPFASQELSMMLARLRTDDLEFLAAMVADGKVTPVLDYSFPLEEAADAIRYSETGRARGKILIRID
ncbi:MAG: NAD(P)-dependent alcohol dehydrogenase [Woeseiaceae bacterium]|jgi:NADPH:quinone reductase-like Zn-dependent oxidoreductase